MTNGAASPSGIAPTHARNPTARILALTIGLAAIALGALALVFRAGPVLGSSVPWWALATAFGFAETFSVHIQFRREAHSFSVGEVPLVMGLFFIQPALLVPVHLLGAGLEMLLHRRQRGLKLAFNLSQMAMQSAVALAIFHAALALGPAMGPAGWTGALAAILITSLASDFAVTAAISISEGKRQFVPPILGFSVGVSLANTCLGLTAAVVLWAYPPALWMLLALAAVLVLAYRGYASLRSEHESLEQLYSSARATQRSMEIEEITGELLSALRSMFRAEMAEVMTLSEDGTSVTVTALTEGGEVRVDREPLDPGQGIWAHVAGQGRGLLLHAQEEPHVRGYLARRGITDAIVAPLLGKDGVFGLVTAANRMGEVRGFNEEDLRLFETMVGHAAVSLENGQLVSELRLEASERERQALHDALTGLPNRQLFEDRVNAALRKGTGHGLTAVLLIDLDRFKEINDALGHPNGNLLLTEVGTRLASVVGEHSTARLGGDEFAVLATGVTDTREALARARDIRNGLERPFTVAGLSVEVEGSIGVALAPEHGTDASTLLQRADVAMYLAKAQRAGAALYDAEQDEYSPARLELIGDLRTAIHDSTLELAYQPKASLPDGRIVGVEALVRWNHPRLGPLLPDRFIPLAEHTGLIKPMTLEILRLALKQMGEWRNEGREISVAVNLSARNVQDLDFPAQAARLLREHRTRPRDIVFELTETAIVTDLQRSKSVLEALSDLGTAISIDDFGTGYSSLSLLKELPVSEIKIDRSFVMAMDTNPSDAAIVRSTIDLAQNLGVRVVAEGVETQSVWHELADHGCHVAQGYFLSRPLPAAQVMEWLRRYERSEGDHPQRRAEAPSRLRAVTPGSA